MSTAPQEPFGPGTCVRSPKWTSNRIISGSCAPTPTGSILLLVTVVIALGPWILNHFRARPHRALRRQRVALHGDLPLASGCLPRHGGARSSQRRRPRWLNSRSCPSVLAHLPVSSYDSLKQVSGVASHRGQVGHLESAWKTAIRSLEQTLRPGMLGVRPLSRDILVTRVGRVACSILDAPRLATTSLIHACARP